MDDNEKDKLKRYGKLVKDFANGKTTDDVLISYFNNLQAVFNFSDDFTNNALTRFPTKQMINDVLSIKEQKLFEILLRRNEILNSCNGYFLAKKYSFHIDKYDPITLMFTMSEENWGDGELDEPPASTVKIIPEKEIEAYIDNYAITDSGKNDYKAKLKTLVELCNQIERIKPMSMSKDRFVAIKAMAIDYPQISKVHNYVKDVQQYLKHVLSQIIEADNAYESAGFKNILSRYNTIQKTKYFINDDHKLIEISPFIENYFLARNSCFSKKEIFSNQRIFEAPISYCLVEFLKNTEYSGKERMAICLDCKCFFCKSKLNAHQKYCPNCSKKNHTPKDLQALRTKTTRAAKKKKIEKEKRKELYEGKCKQLIKEGYSEKEAKQFADQCVIEQLHVIE